ncbi:MAG: OmpA family protein [Bacteroidales bacterium]|nr:OmpA family protein [Bacteroidales bacterium]
MSKSLILFVLFFLTISCVPPTRFKSLQDETTTCQQERELLKAANEQLTVDNKEMKARLAAAEKDLTRAGRDTLKWKQESGRLMQENLMLKNDYSDLQESRDALMKGSENEIRKLMDELQAAQKDLQKRENDLKKMSDDLTVREDEFDQMQLELNRRNERLAELEKGLKDQETLLSDLKQKVSGALLGFENQGLSVSRKNGKVYVSLDEKLLFKSGSTTVDPRGVQALKKLASVLEQNPDINVMIEGHTDDVQVLSGSAFKDNWDLSVLRATSIVRILLEGSAINPQRLTTAGRSQYLPVDPGKTPEARQKNRRTEIILSPKLDELYKMLGE